MKNRILSTLTNPLHKRSNEIFKNKSKGITGPFTLLPELFQLIELLKSKTEMCFDEPDEFFIDFLKKKIEKKVKEPREIINSKEKQNVLILINNRIRDRLKNIALYADEHQYITNMIHSYNELYKAKKPFRKNKNRAYALQSFNIFDYHVKNELCSFINSITKPVTALLNKDKSKCSKEINKLNKLIMKPTQIENIMNTYFCKILFAFLSMPKDLGKPISLEEITDDRKYKYDYYYPSYKQKNGYNSVMIQDNNHIEPDKNSELEFSLTQVWAVLKVANPHLYNQLEYYNIYNEIMRYSNCSVKFFIKEILSEFEFTAKKICIPYILGFDTIFGFTTHLQEKQELDIINQISDLCSKKEYVQTISYQTFVSDTYTHWVQDDPVIGALEIHNIPINLSDYFSITTYYADGSSGSSKVVVDRNKKKKTTEEELNGKPIRVTKTEFVNVSTLDELSNDDTDQVYLKSERLKIRPIFAGNFKQFLIQSRLNKLIETHVRCPNIWSLCNPKDRMRIRAFFNSKLNDNINRSINGLKPKYVFLSVDFSNFDHTIKFSTIKKVVKILIERIAIIYHPSIKEYILQDLHDFLTLKPKVEYDGKKFTYEDGMLSGWKFTNIIESFINMYFCREAIKLMKENEGIDLHHEFSIGNGDDNATCLRVDSKHTPTEIAALYQKYIEQFGFKYNAKKSLPSYYMYEWLKEIYTYNGIKVGYGFRQWTSFMYKQPVSSAMYQLINELFELGNVISSTYNCQINPVLKVILERSKISSVRSNVAFLLNGNFDIKREKILMYTVLKQVEDTPVYKALIDLIPDHEFLNPIVFETYMSNYQFKETIIKKEKKVDGNLDTALTRFYDPILNESISISHLNTSYFIQRYSLETKIPSISDYNLSLILNKYLLENKNNIKKIAVRIAKNNMITFTNFYGHKVLSEVEDYIYRLNTIDPQYANRLIKYRLRPESSIKRLGIKGNNTDVNTLVRQKINNKIEVLLTNGIAIKDQTITLMSNNLVEGSKIYESFLLFN